MDEIQYASERDLAIRNVDRESSLLRDVKGALRRIHDGSFGTTEGVPDAGEVQARRRKHATRACRPRGIMQVEHEYFRCGAWAYIAGLDVHHARIFGRCETQNGIEPFDRLVEQVMTRPPYNDARRCSRTKKAPHLAEPSRLDRRVFGQTCS